MRPLRECTHFTCAHGAPHGNASIWSELDAAAGDRITAAGERAASLARCSAALADSVMVVALAVLALRACGRDEWASELVVAANALLVLPASAWRALVAGLTPLLLTVARILLSLVICAFLGLLGLVGLTFALHALGIELPIPRAA